MKHLTLISHTNVQQELNDYLNSTKQVPGFTISHVEGHGLEVEDDAFLSARDKTIGHTPRLRIDILLEDNDVESVLASIRAVIPDIKNQGIYWVTSVEKTGRL